MTLSLSSPAFQDGGEIPRRYGYKNGNASPPLEISGVPPGCEELVLIMDDPDAVAAVGKVWVHWTVWNIRPDTDRIGESAAPSGCRQGATDFGETGYGGPAPPDRRHTYVFRLYAVDTRLDAPQGAERNAVEKSMADHIIEHAVLTGTYEP